MNNGGVLVAVDGLATGEAARSILAERKSRGQAALSVWDASGVFHELHATAEEPSPKTLLLLYAADLAFRLRWEIEPGLASGVSMIAAPYLAAPSAFALAAGVSQEWIDNLFAFAPPPIESLRAPDHAAADGFIAFAMRSLGWNQMQAARIAANLAL